MNDHGNSTTGAGTPAKWYESLEGITDATYQPVTDAGHGTDAETFAHLLARLSQVSADMSVQAVALALYAGGLGAALGDYAADSQGADLAEPLRLAFVAHGGLVSAAAHAFHVSDHAARAVDDIAQALDALAGLGVEVPSPDAYAYQWPSD